MEVGAVSVMLYCFRERETAAQPERAARRLPLFPSYMRVGGLREDLPRDFLERDAARSSIGWSARSSEYEDLLTKNEIYIERTKGVGIVSGEDAIRYSLVGPIARAAGVNYDVRKAFPYNGYETFDFTVPLQTGGDVYSRYLVRRRRDAARASASATR